MKHRLGVLGWPVAHSRSPAMHNAAFRSLGLPHSYETLDVTARRELMVQLEKILQDDGPIVQPVWRAIFTFHDKRVQGFKVHPTL